MSRVVLFNPHVHGLYRLSVYKVLIKYPATDKLGYVLSYLIANGGINVYLDSSESSVPRMLKWRWLTRLEFLIWCLVHKIPAQKVRVIPSNKLLPTDRLIFSIKNVTSKTVDVLAQLDAVKILNTNHFMTRASERGDLVKKIGVDRFWAESKLDSSAFFQHFYGSGQPVWFVPYVPSSRFRRITPFDKRRVKCAGLGSVSCFCDNEAAIQDVKKYFDSPTYHPVRKALFDNWRKVSSLVDVYVTPFAGRDHCLKNKDDPPQGNDFDYYKADLVELMNQYQFVIYGEEINDMPALGMYEAMKCGCLIVGTSSQVYTDIGLVHGESYICFGDTFEPDQFLMVMEEFMAQPERLSAMAENSYRIAQQSISEERSLNQFISMVAAETEVAYELEGALSHNS